VLQSGNAASLVDPRLISTLLFHPFKPPAPPSDLHSLARAPYQPGQVSRVDINLKCSNLYVNPFQDILTLSI
jgi:hypothetical protein